MEKREGGWPVMKRNKNKRKSFTLLELLVVVVILSILAGLALPQYLKTVARSRESEAWQMIASLRSAEFRYYAEYNLYNSGTPPAALDVDIPSTGTQFNYNVTVLGSTFTVSARPKTSCAACRLLTMDDVGVKAVSTN